ncbi:alpha-N-arabinofuranosidase [Dysgonomonas sp. Marseille-P4677]|uniref:alpha-N-arabinofuranosidase n=1 Tax=Dysgonomonas sp. Marseille-P4677 TaxID=2364790 RepID=UPI001912F08A|nr:alpha-N-arabinofuranosidase [Dysgonomonas sp. Marseille-P4677]MBK5720953.1 alpha-N-arabinofuranosidase [Dysgonomonas sp. Marseille-P4677]
MKKNLLLCLFLFMYIMAFSQQKAEMVVNTNQGKYKIDKHIYGHFSEHLGHCIYDGLWVGENSNIPNINGVRKDIIDALKHIKIPNLRWPGGCFADEYHWMDGIGDRANRPKMVNTHWGGVVEDNSFGTHEFLNLCEVLETEPYICGNMGSGTVEEMSKWVEYITSDGESPMSNLRKKNGREKPWKISLWGVGNENWGCGGNMTAEGYAENYRRYATYCRNYGENKLYKVAGGPNVDDYRWMEIMMKNIPHHMMSGVSVHNYTFTYSWENKGNALNFNEDEYFSLLEHGMRMDEIVTKHAAIMDKYDPKKNIAMIVDEWGAWYNVEPGTNPGFLFQQNTLRDALLAGTILNIFHKHCDRVRIANIAQLVNVLQALFITEGDKMLLTPTYHVFDMYKVHQDATMLPIDIISPSYSRLGKEIKSVSASASKDSDGKIHISFVNIDPNQSIDITCNIKDLKNTNSVSGNIITAPGTSYHNTFAKPNEVVLKDFKEAKIKDGTLTLKMPAKSLVTIEIK